MKYLLLSVLLLPLAPTVRAQQVPANLSLEDAIGIAKQRNPAYRRSMATLRSAGVDVRAGWGAFLPDVTGRLNFVGTTGTTVTGQDDFGRATNLPSPVDFQQSSASQSVSSSLTLFDGFQSLNTYRASRAARDAAAAGVDSEERKLVAEVARRFYDALNTRRLIELEQRLLESAREQLDANQRLFRVAAASRVDVLGAQVDVSRQEIAVDRVQSEARKAILALREEIGIEEDIEFETVGALPEPFDPSVLDPEELVKLAFEASPTMSQLEANRRSASLRASAARGQRLPSITASATYSRSVNLGSYDALFDFNPQNRSFQFSLGLSWPLFNNFQTDQRVAQADLTYRRADEDLREGRLQLERSVRSGYIDLQNAYESVQLARRAADLSRQRVTLARQQFRLGAIPFTNLQTVIDGASQAERDLITRELDFAKALVTLEERIGRQVGSRR